MTMRNELKEIPARKGLAVSLKAGTAIRIVNTFGHQVVDFWAFYPGDLHRYLSMEHTRATLNRLTPCAGDVLVDNHREPILSFESDDSPGIHDTLIAACDQYRYEKLGCQGYHDSCADNLRNALAALGLYLKECPASLNLWMNIPVQSDGTFRWLPPASKPGQGVTLRALVNCIVVMSACPQDIIPINAGHPVSAHFAVIAD